MKFRFGYLCAAALVLGSATTATAQIYSWRDANGHLVVSNVHAAQGLDTAAQNVPKTSTQSSRPSFGRSLTDCKRFDCLSHSESANSTVGAAAPAPPGGPATFYEGLISQHALLRGVRRDLVRAVVQVESAFNPYAQSPKGALGLMQLMPATIQRFGVVNPFNPSDNVRAGVAYLRELLDRYDDNEELALAAYNAGPGAVDNYGQTVPPYPETRSYVTRVRGIAGPEKKPEPGRFYKTVEIINGREVVRYTDRKPR